MGTASWTFRDKSRESSAVQLIIPDVSAGGTDFDAVMASVAALGAAIDTLTLCAPAAENYVQEVDPPSADIPTDDAAQREYGLRIFYTDDVNSKQFHFTIPGPDFAQVDTVAGTDLADLSAGGIPALITAVDGNVLSPYGNAVTLRRVVVVGRRS